MRAPWSAQQIEQAKMLYEQRASEELFVRLTGHSKKAAYNKLNRSRYSHAVGHYVMTDTRISVPDDVWEDRNRRLMAQKSLTAQLLGDPEDCRRRL